MIRLVLWMMLFVTPVAAWSQQPAGSGELLPLDEAVRLALQSNRTVKNAVVDVEKADAQLRAARTKRLPSPQVGLTEAYTLLPLDVSFKRGDLGTLPGVGPVPPEDTTIRQNPTFVTSLTARVTQPLSQLYRIGLGIDQQELSRDLARQNVRLQRQTIVNRVKGAYYQVLLSQSAFEAAQETIRSYRELARVIEDQLKEQAALRVDLLEVRNRLAGAELSALTIEHDLATRKEQLNYLLGRPADTSFRVSPVPDAGRIETDPAGAATVALSQRPEISQASLQLRSAESSLKMKKAEFIPDLSLVFGYLSPITSEVLPRNIAYISLELSWEIFDWGRKRQEAAALRGAVDQAQRSLEDVRAQIELDVRAALRKLEEARVRVGVTQLGQEAARERLRVTSNQYREKAALLKDVLQAQASLASAEDQYQQGLLGLWTAEADLERALGAAE